nr:MAG TPA: hypothetical protein [Caudoviricetes sp.]
MFGNLSFIYNARYISLFLSPRFFGFVGIK